MSEFKTITRDELKAKMDNKDNVVLIDVLGDLSYQKAHLPGALGMDGHSDSFVQEVQKVVPDTNKEIVVYCASFQCQLSPAAAKKLADAGYTHVYDFEGGLKDWAKGGYVFEGEEAEARAKALREAE